MADDLDFQDSLADYIRKIEEAEEDETCDLNSPIITSRELKIAPQCTDNVKREQIAWRLYRHPMFYIVTVDEGTKIRAHSHAEDVFRYVIKGSFDIHVQESEKDGSPEISRTVNEGEWVVVRADHSYRIEAGSRKNKDSDDGGDDDSGDDDDDDGDKRAGYVALIAYQMACKPK